MKFICDSKEEYDQLMEASRYMHDFVVWDKDDDGHSLDMDTYPVINTLCHIYLGEDDFPNKKEMIKIVENEDKLSK